MPLTPIVTVNCFGTAMSRINMSRINAIRLQRVNRIVDPTSRMIDAECHVSSSGQRERRGGGMPSRSHNDRVGQ